MLSTLLVSAAIACAPDAPRAPFDHRSALELALRVDANRLHLRNASDAPELVILADRVHGHVVTLTIAAHVELEFGYAANALMNLELTVASRDADGLRFSPSLALARVAECADERTNCRASFPEHAHAWAWIGSNWEPSVSSSEHGAPVPVSGSNARPTRHVPVITPSEGQRGDLPPKLETRPLPAV